MQLSFKTLYHIYFVLWVAVWLFITVSAVTTLQQIKPITIKDVYTGSSGPYGLVRGYYIKNYQHHGPALIRNGSDTTRDYAGFTLARILYPTSSINKARVVTFYAHLKSDRKNITHFAATPGLQPASKFRLYLDVIDFMLLRYCWLTIGFFILSTLLGDIYKWLYRKHDVTNEVKDFYDQSGLQVIVMIAFFLTLFI